MSETQKSEKIRRMLEEHLPATYRFAFQFLGDHHAAQDVVQETMLRAWKNHKKIQNHSSGKSWVLKIAANLCRDRIRRNKHPASRTNSLEGDVETHRSSPLNDALQREQQIQIRSAIANLPNDYRAVMHLHCVEKLSLAEISAVTGDRVGTVKVRLSRARKKMRAALTKLGVLDLEEDRT